MEQWWCCLCLCLARVGFGAMEILPQHAAASAATSRAFYPKTESKAEAGEGWRGQQHWAVGGGGSPLPPEGDLTWNVPDIIGHLGLDTVFSRTNICLEVLSKGNNSPAELCIKVLTTDQCFIPNNHQEWRPTTN